VTDAWLLRLPDGGASSLARLRAEPRSHGSNRSKASRAMKALLLRCCFGLATAIGAAEPARERPERAPIRSSRSWFSFASLPPTSAADGNYASGYADASGRAARRRVAEALARAHGLVLATAWPMPVVGLDCYVMIFPLRAAPKRSRLSSARSRRSNGRSR
jgi:hypothetical protein